MTSETVQSREATRRDAGYVIAFVLSCIAVFWGIFATGLSARALDKSSSNKGVDVASTAAAPAQDVVVTLSEFKIAPATVEVAAGSTLTVKNSGSVQHNLAVKGKDLRTPMINGGQASSLDISKLAAGTYTLICEVPGHETAGMTAQLKVSAGTGEAATGMATMDHSTHTMSADEMDKAMHDRTAAFPAKTEGLGGQLLQATVAGDGTKVFDVTAEVTKWEVESGKFVDAMTYNGVVPGPTIKVNVGDKVRVVLHNKLPESTSIHFHGIDTPNAMDGVPDITQEPVKPGADFTYEFTAKRAQVGMYHSHQDAVKQVPDGLAGAFIIGDMPIPASLGVTRADIKQSIPFMLNDAGTIGFAINGKSFPATAPVVAKPGEWFEVQYMNEGVQIHPMHLHGIDQVVIAKDGHPVPEPEVQDTVTVAPGERYTVLVHATEPGVWAWHCHILPHAEREDGMFGMVTALVVK